MKRNGTDDDLGIPLDKPGKIGHYEKRFGVIALEKGFITKDDLEKGLSVQTDEDLRRMRHRLLGEIFFDSGVMTDRQVEEVVSHIFRKTP